MLVAMNSKGKLVNVLEMIEDKKETYCCPTCKSPVRLKRGKVIRPHFAHINLQNCQFSYENESAEHLDLKSLLYQSLKSKGYQVQVEFPLPAIGQVADLLVEDKLVLEVQCSRLSSDRLRERTLAYRQAGYQVIWLLGKKLWLGQRLSALHKDFLYFSKNMGFHLWELDWENRSIRLRYLLHQHTLGQVIGLTQSFSLSVDVLGVLRQPYASRTLESLVLKQNPQLLQAIQRQLVQKNPYWLRKQAVAYEQGDNLLGWSLEDYYPQWRPIEGEEFVQLTGDVANYREQFLRFYGNQADKTVQTVYPPKFYDIMDKKIFTH